VFLQEQELQYDKANDRFLVYAAEVSHEFILLGELARRNGMNEVKELGKLMEEGHRKILSELTVLARKQLVTIPLEPSYESRVIYDQMNLLKNELFDAAFCIKQSNILDLLIRKYETIELESGDMDLRNWAYDQLHPLRTQYIHLMGCKQKFEKI
jgi:putative membrane protein